MPHIAPQRYALGRSGWVVVGVLASVRVFVPLLVLAGIGVPGAAAFEYDGLIGDATGFHAAARELIAAWGRLSALAVTAVVFGAAASAVALTVAWRRRRSRAWVVVGAAALAAALACVAISQMHVAGAAVVGWPLVWAVALAPYRAATASLDHDGAYAVAVALSLGANAATVVATAHAALYATARRDVALLASGLFALWPVWIGPLAGDTAAENGTWAVDAGLAAYTEPVSTALVTVALALLLSPAAGDTRLALAGGLLGAATTVKLTNGLLAALALALVLRRVGLRRAVPFAAAGAAFAPVVALYWPKGYPPILEDPDAWPDDPFALGHAATNWDESLLFTPSVVALLVPFALVGAVALGDAWRRWTLVAWVAVNPVVYSFYWATALHPRLLFASLPATFVLWATGALALRRRLFGARSRT